MAHISELSGLASRFSEKERDNAKCPIFNFECSRRENSRKAPQQGSPPCVMAKSAKAEGEDGR